MNLFKLLTCGNKHDPGLNGAEKAVMLKARGAGNTWNFC